MPSIDCAKAKTAAARLICADVDLARLDGELGVAYQRRKAQMPEADRSKFVAEQITWIKERDGRCDLLGRNGTATEVLASYKPCLVSMIRDRIVFLRQAETTLSGQSGSVAITGQSKATITAFEAANDGTTQVADFFDRRGVTLAVGALVVLLVSYRLWRTARVRRAVARKVAAAIRQHLTALVRRREQLVTKDAYGKPRLEDWAKEIEYFIEEHVKRFLTGQEEYAAFMRERSGIASAIAAKVEQEREAHPAFLTFSDDMTGNEFETYCAEELRRAGWNARVTMRSRDQGVDVVAEKLGVRVVLQCKLYSRAVGNKAVQEAAAGRAHEQADYGIVVSNNRYTHDAEQLASTNGIFLIHYRDLRTLDDIIGRKPPSAPRLSRTENSEPKGSGSLGPASSL
jgi:restriction system protein